MLASMQKPGASEIEQAVSESGIQSYTGEYRELGGGELNDTFLLTLDDSQVILRIAKHADQVRGLAREANALKQLDSPFIPKLLYFDPTSTILGRRWIL